MECGYKVYLEREMKLEHETLAQERDEYSQSRHDGAAAQPDFDVDVWHQQVSSIEVPDALKTTLKSFYLVSTCYLLYRMIDMVVDG